MNMRLKCKRFLALLLVITTLLCTVVPQNCFAADGDVSMADIVELFPTKTKLPVNGWKDWKQAFVDGIQYPGFFHDKVEEHIRNNNVLENDELPISGAGTYGINGRADLWLEQNKIVYVWDVKPASWAAGYKYDLAINQITRYTSKLNYKVGSNAYIADNNKEGFPVEVTSADGKVTLYQVYYSNSLVNDGLIFYYFERIGDEAEEKENAEEEAKEPVTDPSVVPIIPDDDTIWEPGVQPGKVPAAISAIEKEYATDTIVYRGYERSENQKVVDNAVDWGEVSVLVSLASSLSAVCRAEEIFWQDSPTAALATYSENFVLNIGKTLSKAGIRFVGGTMAEGIMLYLTSGTAEAADIDFQEINDLVGLYEDALTLLLDIDSIDEILDVYGGCVDSDELEQYIKGIQDENEKYEDACEAQPPRDPLVIDFGETGIDLCTLEQGVNFDLDNNGYAEKTAWIDVEDGFLALDRNENGVIDNGGELFGDKVEIEDGVYSRSGFEALSVLDENADGVIDASDSCYENLLVWIDANHNGYSERTELRTLKSCNIEKIDLNYVESSIMDEHTGTRMAETARVALANGEETTISEFWFPVNASDTTYGDIVTAGNVLGIEQAIAEDETGELLELVNAFTASKTITVKRYYLKRILYFITDSTDILANSRGGNMDARDLHVIEQFMGRAFKGVGGTNPNSNAAAILKSIYKDIEDYYYNILNLYSAFGGYKDLILQYEDENGNSELNMALLAYVFNELILQESEDIDMLVYDLGIYLKSYDQIHNTDYFKEYYKFYGAKSGHFSDIVTIAKDSNAYLGTANADSYGGSSLTDFIFGEDGNDSLSGSGGADYIYGGAGNDTLDGGAGNDLLIDDGGDDTYVFGKGYGNDVIRDNGGSNIIKFKNLSASDILVNGIGENDVCISIKGTKDTLTIVDFCLDEVLADYTLIFTDKTMHCSDADSPFRHIYGTDEGDILKSVYEDSIINAFGGNDTITGYIGEDIIYSGSGDDIIHAGAGNDYIYGGDGGDAIYGEEGDDFIFGDAGDDLIDGGSGNDYLLGGEGNDTYVFGKGYGIDIVDDIEGVSVIEILGDYTVNDIKCCVYGDEVILTISDSTDTLILVDAAGHLDLYSLSVGDSVMSIEELLVDNSSVYQANTEYADYMPVNEVSGNIVSGGKGNDYIIGTDNEEYIFGDADDDRLTAGAGNDTIYGSTGNDAIFGEDGDDIILAGAVDDYVSGGEGNDIISSGPGTDVLDGGPGDDTYLYNPGDGTDIIMDSDGDNRIIFGEGLESSKIRAYRSDWNDLLITFDGLDDTLTIKNYCISEAARSFRLIFADGTAVNATDINSPLRTIYGTDGSEYMISIYEDGMTKIGEAGDDQLVGSDGVDILYGNAGDDRLCGNAGNDILDGGTGNDYLYGQAGNDTYIYKAGYGIDVISDNEGTNTIEIMGYSREQIRAYRTNWNDITITFGNEDDKLVIEGFFTSLDNRNFYLSFNGGSKVHATAFNSPLRTIYGTDSGNYIVAMDDQGVTLYGEGGNDTLNGGNGADKLYGNDGDDTLYGNGGNDILCGGKGNDILYGGVGNDTYIWNSGDGNDIINDNSGVNTILFGNGVTLECITVYRTNWNDLTITVGENEEKLVIQNFFVSEDHRRFDVIFADGTQFSYSDSDNPLKNVYLSDDAEWMSAWSDEGIVYHGMSGSDYLIGGAGDDWLYGEADDDYLYGCEGDDILSGGTGNDHLYGGAGDDTYIFAAGYGQDVISDTEGVNTIRLTALSPDQVTFELQKSNEDDYTLYVSINGQEDLLTIFNYSEEHYIFEFDDEQTGYVTEDGLQVLQISE